MEPWSLRRALHRSVYTAIVLAAHTEMAHIIRLVLLIKVSEYMGLICVKYCFLYNIVKITYAPESRLLPDKHLGKALSIYKKTIS